MLDHGTVIEVQLPGKQKGIAKVVRCNRRGSSCTIELANGEQQTVNLTSLNYKVVEGDAVPSTSPPTSQPSSSERQQHVGNGLDADSGDHEEHEQASDSGDDADDAADGDEDAGTSSGEEAIEDDDGDKHELDAFQPEAASKLEELSEAVQDPGAFLQPSSQVAELAREAAKALYDYAAAAGAGERSGGGSLLPELYVEGFDPEQIWLQLEMAAEPALKRAKKLLKKVGQEPSLLDPETEEALDDLLEGAAADSDADLEGSGDESPAREDDSEGAAADLADVDYDALLAGAAQRRRGDGSPGDEDDLQGDAELASDMDEDEGGAGAETDDEEGVELAGRKRKSAGAKRGAAAFEDDFLKVDELEQFLEQVEAEEGRQDQEGVGKGDESEEDEFDEGAEEDNAGSDSDADMEALLANAVQLAGGKAKQRRVRFADESEGEEDEEQEGAGAKAEEARYEDFFGPRKGTPFRLPAGKRRRQEEEVAEEKEDSEEEGKQGSLGGIYFSEDEDEDEEPQQPSTHERRLKKIADKVKRLEAEAMGEKDWFMKGEVVAGQRPKNSALEIDLDFETSVKPPPQPTEESTKSLEDLIKKRVADGSFDDVVRIVAAPVETKRTTVELDDKKSNKGLGELYEEEYQRAITGVSEDKDEEVRQSAKAQFTALCAKLDALSHLHYRPKPIIEEVTVKVDVPAIMMEEVAPQFVSEASMRTPEEVFGAEAGGAPRSEAELSREDRKRRRAQKKRASKKRRSQKDEERASRTAALGGTAPLAGRKSEAAQLAQRKMKKDKGSKGAAETMRLDYSKSAAVFAKIQEERDRGGKAADGSAADAGPPAARFKL